MKKLHLGCGQKRKEGWINVDQLTSVNPDIVLNLNSSNWPFADNSIDQIFSDNVLEHLDSPIRCMEECYRILKPGGCMESVVPFAMSAGALQDPTHKSFWTDYTVYYFVKGHKANFYTHAGFEVVFNRLVSNKDTLRCRIRNLIPFRSVLKLMLFGMFDHVHFKLRKPL
jgi:predicted SAM-dependent methyltransferase